MIKNLNVTNSVRPLYRWLIEQREACWLEPPNVAEPEPGVEILRSLLAKTVGAPPTIVRWIEIQVLTILSVCLLRVVLITLHA